MFRTLVFFVYFGICAAQKNDPDSIVFIDEQRPSDPRINLRFPHTYHYHQHDSDGTAEQPHSDNNKEQIPLEFILKLNEISDLSELSQYLEDGSTFETDLLANRFGIMEKAAGTMPKMAKCTPTPQVVELKHPNDTNIWYFPSCTRVDRCNGCCGHSLLECQATQTETVAFTVQKLQYSGGEKFGAKDKETIFVEKHTKCKCGCRIKKEDCNPSQQYKENECRCVCMNLDEKKKCDSKNDKKLWDPEVCKCRCREVSECSTGLYFDQQRCQCLQVPMKRRFAELHSSRERPFNEREKYNVDSVTPLKTIK